LGEHAQIRTTERRTGRRSRTVLTGISAPRCVGMGQTMRSADFEVAAKRRAYNVGGGGVVGRGPVLDCLSKLGF